MSRLLLKWYLMNCNRWFQNRNITVLYYSSYEPSLSIWHYIYIWLSLMNSYSFTEFGPKLYFTSTNALNMCSYSPLTHFNQNCWKRMNSLKYSNVYTKPVIPKVFELSNISSINIMRYLTTVQITAVLNRFLFLVFLLMVL